MSTLGVGGNVLKSRLDGGVCVVNLGSQRSEAGVQIKLRYFNTSFGECEVAVLKESTSPTELHVNSAGGIEGDRRGLNPLSAASTLALGEKYWGVGDDSEGGIGWCGRRSISGVRRLLLWHDTGQRSWWSLKFNVPCPTT